MPSVSWFVWQAVIAIIAMLGGVMVFLGLWLEGPPGTGETSDAEAKRLHRVREKRGWKILMLGIAVEILVAGLFAVREGWQARETGLQIAKNDPLVQPIADVSAIALIKVKGGNFEEVDMKALFHGAISWSAYMTMVNSNRETTAFSLGGVLVANGFSKMFSGTNFSATGMDRMYSMRFHLEDLGMIQGNRKARDINEVSGISICTMFLPTNVTILGGQVKLVINSEVQRTFDIQTNASWVENPLAPSGAGYMLFATNHTAAAVLPKAGAVTR